MPAKAGIQGPHAPDPSRDSWIPAFAGMTDEVGIEGTMRYTGSSTSRPRPVIAGVQ